MNKKLIIVIALLVFFSIAILIGPNFAEDRTYSINSATIHIYIQENGSIHVVETIQYVFSGTYNGVTRDIPFKSNEKIENLNVSTSGAYSKFTTNDKDGQKHITVYLYSDSENTKPITNREVNVTYEYDFINVVDLYNDGATLHYTLWGDKWDVDLAKLNAFIHLNNKTEVKYWLNPSEFILTNKWNNNTLEIATDELNSGQLFELRMILPKDYFTNPIYAVEHDNDGVLAFENLQKEYENGVNFFTPFYGILSLIMFFLCFFPLVVYFKYGREPKILYQGDYERDIPTNDSPAIVNALYSGSVGSVNMDAFKATILSLIDKKYLQMENFENSKDTIENGTYNNPTIRFTNDSDLSNISSTERSALKTLKIFADRNEKLDLIVFQNDMKDEYLAKKFRDYYTSWCKEVESEAEKNIERFFISTGHTYALLIGLGGLILSGIIMALFIFEMLPFNYVWSFAFFILTSILLIIVSIISMVLPNHIFGRWTVEGRENRKKWQNFKKYLKDFSLIKEYPPSSIVIWNQYLVYATALGHAKSVQKAMENLIPEETLNTSNSYMFYGYGGAYLFSSFDTGMSTASASDSSSGGGGSGGFGGGSGGGGGGAF